MHTHEELTLTTDSQLERRVRGTLWALHVPALRFLEIEAHDGVVTLRGRVRSYYERQLAQTRARNVPGVDRVVDALTVARHVPIVLHSRVALTPAQASSLG